MSLEIIFVIAFTFSSDKSGFAQMSLTTEYFKKSQLIKQIAEMIPPFRSKSKTSNNPTLPSVRYFIEKGFL